MDESEVIEFLKNLPIGTSHNIFVQAWTHSVAHSCFSNKLHHKHNYDQLKKYNLNVNWFEFPLMLYLFRCDLTSGCTRTSPKWIHGYIMCISNIFLFSKSWRTIYLGLFNLDLQFSLKVLTQKFCSFHYRPKDDVWMKILSLLQKIRIVQFVTLLSLNDITFTLWRLIFVRANYCEKVFKIFFNFGKKTPTPKMKFSKFPLKDILPDPVYCTPKILSFMGITFCKFCKLAIS